MLKSEKRDLFKEVDALSRGVRSRKRKREAEKARGGRATRSHRSLLEILELEPNSKRHKGSLEDPSVDEELRVYEEGAGNITRAGCVARRDS